MRKNLFHAVNDIRSISLITVFVRTFRRNTELLINIIFNERRKIGEKHRDIKFLKNRDGGSTIEIFNGESAF